METHILSTVPLDSLFDFQLSSGQSALSDDDLAALLMSVDLVFAVTTGALNLRKSLFAKHAKDLKLDRTVTIDMPTTRPAAILAEEWWEVDSVAVVDATEFRAAHLDWVRTPIQAGSRSPRACWARTAL